MKLSLRNSGRRRKLRILKSRMRSTFGHTAADRFLVLGPVMITTGLAFVLVPGLGGLVAVGATVVGAGFGSVVAGVSLRASARAHAQTSGERAAEASAAVAARLQASKDHADQHFGAARLFHPVILRGHRFSGANLDGVAWSEGVLEDCDFSGALLRRAHLADWSAENLNFEGAVLDGARLQGVFYKTNFAGAHCGRTDFTSANLHVSSFASVPGRTSWLRSADFSGSSGLDGVDFTRAHAESVRFVGAEAYGAVFDDAFLCDADFTEAILAGCSFRGAVLSDRQTGRPANLADARVSEGHGALEVPTDFSEAWLMGVDLSRVIGLEHSLLAGALANPATIFPSGFDPSAHGVLLLHEMHEQQALEAYKAWLELHARPAGWWS